MHAPEGYRIVTVADDPAVKDVIQNLMPVSWPAFMLEDDLGGQFWMELYKQAPECQFVLYRGDDTEALAAGNSTPLRWKESLDLLPGEGYDWAIRRGVGDLRVKGAPNLLSALAITIHPRARSQGLSRIMVEAMRQIAHEQKLQALIAPVRPSQKSSYPLMDMQRYITWKTPDGLPFDPWMRVHVRLGARVAQVCPRSMLIDGSVAEWEAWSGMKLPETGSYVIPGALVPVEINVEKDTGLYIEPNVWHIHAVA